VNICLGIETGASGPPDSWVGQSSELSLGNLRPCSRALRFIQWPRRFGGANSETALPACAGAGSLSARRQPKRSVTRRFFIEATEVCGYAASHRRIAADIARTVPTTHVVSFSSRLGSDNPHGRPQFHRATVKEAE